MQRNLCKWTHDVFIVIWDNGNSNNSSGLKFDFQKDHLGHKVIYMKGWRNSKSQSFQHLLAFAILQTWKQDNSMCRSALRLYMKFMSGEHWSFLSIQGKEQLQHNVDNTFWSKFDYEVNNPSCFFKSKGIEILLNIQCSKVPKTFNIHQILSFPVQFTSPQKETRKQRIGLRLTWTSVSLMTWLPLPMWEKALPQILLVILMKSSRTEAM